jgi:hypothetical protein
MPARTKVGVALLVAVIGALSGSIYVAIPLILVAMFLIIWGLAPVPTETFVSGLPWGTNILRGLRHIDPLIQRRDTPEIDYLADDIDWAIQNLLNRNPTPRTPQEVAQWESDYRPWCDDISQRLGNRELFSRADQVHFDTLGFVQPLLMSGNPQLDKLLSELKMKIDRLRDVISWAQQR